MTRTAQRAMLAALFAAAVLPLLLLVVLSVGRGWFYPNLLPNSLDWSAWSATLGSGGRLTRALVSTMLLGIGTGIGSTLLGWPIGRALAGLTGWHRNIGAGLAFLPIAIPPVGIATGLQLSLTTVGLGGTMPGVLLGHLVPATGYTALYFLGVFTVFDSRMEEAARTLGASESQVLLRITLPALAPQFRAALLLGFLVSWAQVVLTLVIGGGAVGTMPVEVYGYMLAGQVRFAAVGALLLIIPPLLLFGVVRLLVGRVVMVLP